MTWDRAQAASVGSRLLTSWAMAQPARSLLMFPWSFVYPAFRCKNFSKYSNMRSYAYFFTFRFQFRSLNWPDATELLGCHIRHSTNVGECRGGGNGGGTSFQLVNIKRILSEIGPIIRITLSYRIRWFLPRLYPLEYQRLFIPWGALFHTPSFEIFATDVSFTGAVGEISLRWQLRHNRYSDLRDKALFLYTGSGVRDWTRVSSAECWSVLCPSTPIFCKLSLKLWNQLHFKCCLEENTFWYLTLSSKVSL
jgi:hypothetical protein